MTALLAAFLLVPAFQEPQLRSGDIEEGFLPLFDGKSLSGWKGYKQANPPANWKAENGELIVRPGSGGGGDISTAKEYADFDLRLEWNVSKNGNSGIIYRSGGDYDACWKTGPEYQVFDDFRGGQGQAGPHSAGAMYDMYIPSKFVSKPPGEWNETRIVAKGSHIEHWLNGTKIVETEVGSEDWNSRYDKSKFKAFPEFARKKKGYILLQDHGAELRFRNIRIKEL